MVWADWEPASSCAPDRREAVLDLRRKEPEAEEPDSEGPDDEEDEEADTRDSDSSTSWRACWISSSPGCTSSAMCERPAWNKRSMSYLHACTHACAAPP
jgi:hypothetical protein